MIYNQLISDGARRAWQSRELLLAAKADMAMQSMNGSTPLHAAARKFRNQDNV